MNTVILDIDLETDLTTDLTTDLRITREQAFPFLSRKSGHQMGIVKTTAADYPLRSPHHAELMTLRHQITEQLKRRNLFYSPEFLRHARVFNAFSKRVFPKASIHFSQPVERQGLGLWAEEAEEDVFILHAREEGTIALVAGHTCFPSRWNPLERVGESLFALHGPVPEMGKLPKMIQALFHRMTREDVFYRVNWSLTDDPDWHQPETRSCIKQSLAAGATVLDAVFYRTEKQHIMRIAEDLWVFLVNVRQHPLSRFMHDLSLISALSMSIQSWSTDMRRYKSWERYAAYLQPELERILSDKRRLSSDQSPLPH